MTIVDKKMSHFRYR